jgi:polar amino acid transport system permease protein
LNSVAADIAAPERPRTSRGWPRERIAGYAFMGLWILLGLALLAFMVGSWDRELIDKYAPIYVDGLITTMLLVSVSIVIGAILAVPVTYGRMSENRVLSGLAYSYVYFFRGTPLLAQAFMVYYGAGALREQFEAIGLWWFFREAWACAFLAFSLNTAAYQAEIFRGAIESVHKGQWEGAASLGLHKLQILRKVVLPQAAIVALRPLGNEVILMIKGSAVASIITVYDLMGQTQLAYSRTYDFQTYIWAAMIYLSMVEVLRHGVEWIERRITRHLKR